MTTRWIALATIVLGGCSEPDRDAGSGALAGRVVVSGPLRGAQIAIDQIDGSARDFAIRAHVGDTTSDADGRFAIDVGRFNGLLLVTARGGEFTDLVSGARVQLDASTALESIAALELFEQRGDVVVSPVGHLIAARTRGTMAGDIAAAFQDAASHLDRHFGNVDWSRVEIASLDASATSPTEPVRAALVQAALSVLATDIATEAGASAQDVNVYTLTQRLADDIRLDIFDGNDGNSPRVGEGLQLGVCPPKPGCTAVTSCALGTVTQPAPGCRPACDLYANTPRTLLAGEMTKVITSATFNHTGLRVADILPVARSMADNVDEVLFGAACTEELDRLPPTITFVESMTPAANAFVRGTIGVQVTADDDGGPTGVHTTIFVDDTSLPDADGDIADNTARAVIDTTVRPAGTLAVRAEARDLAGNTASITRTFTVDNLAPALTVASTGFLVDGTTFWTDQAAPVLRGTVTDDAPITVVARIGADQFPATLTGQDFQIALPAGEIDLAGKEVAVVATDAAGNQTTVVQTIRADLTAPELTVQPSIVHDEKGEAPTFDPASEVPQHLHGGADIDLATGGSCPAVTKFSYLLGASSPPFAEERDEAFNLRRNPVAYTFIAGDTGVGLSTGATKYRVGHRDSAGVITWLTPLVGAGAGTPVGTGFQQFVVAVVDDAVPGLSTTEGTYEVELSTTDRFGRTTITSRCFDLHLRAPPLDFAPPAGFGMPTPGPAQRHPLALQPPGVSCPDGRCGLTLAGPGIIGGVAFDKVAAALLNDDASGASLLDQPFVNGTAETIFLTVDVQKPMSIVATRRFQIRNVKSTQSATLSCDFGAPTIDPRCNTVSDPGGAYASLDEVQNPINNPAIPVKVFELDASNNIVGEIPCIAPCTNTATDLAPSFRFAIPPRAFDPVHTTPFRRFVAMTMIGQVTALWPRDTGHPGTAPWLDGTVNGFRFTGKAGVPVIGCASVDLSCQPQNPDKCTCSRITRFDPINALTHARLTFSDAIKSTYTTAPTAQLPPTQPTPMPQTQARAPSGWETFEGTLP